MSYWLRTKTGRLKAPKERELPYDELLNKPVPEVGTFVRIYPSVSAGTIGRVEAHRQVLSNQALEVELLDGKKFTAWNWMSTPIPYEAVQEVKDFYIADGRPDRIKVTW